MANSILSLGDEVNTGRTLDVFFNWRSWVLGIAWERHRGEAEISVHVGPLVARLWWFR